MQCVCIMQRIGGVTVRGMHPRCTVVSGNVLSCTAAHAHAYSIGERCARRLHSRLHLEQRRVRKLLQPRRIVPESLKPRASDQVLQRSTELQPTAERKPLAPSIADASACRYNTVEGLAT